MMKKLTPAASWQSNFTAQCSNLIVIGQNIKKEPRVGNRGVHFKCPSKQWCHLLPPFGTMKLRAVDSASQISKISDHQGNIYPITNSSV